MATFIDNQSEVEQMNELNRFINKIKNKGNQDAPAPEKLKFNLENLQKLVQESNILFNETLDKETENFFHIVVSLAKRLESDSLNQIVSIIIEKVASSPDDKPMLRMRILVNLYNNLSSNEASRRHQVFLELLKFGSSSKNTELFFNQLKESDIDSKIADWKLTPTQKRELLKQIKDMFVNLKSPKAFKWSIKYLTSLDEQGNEDEKRTSLDEAVKIISEAIRMPDFYQFDSLVNIPICSKLETSSIGNHRPAYQLLKIFSNETQEAYQTFLNNNSGFDFASIGLNKDETLRKIRLLSLATLGSAALSQQSSGSISEVPYTLIVKTLQIPESEVEMWVISAISENVIAARMDQLRRVVVISRAIQRVFSDSQWKQIGESIQNWKKNVKVMLNTLQETKKLNPQQQHQAFAKAIQQHS